MTLCPSRPKHNFHRWDCKLVRRHDPFPPYSVPSPGMQIDAVTVPTSGIPRSGGPIVPGAQESKR